MAIIGVRELRARTAEILRKIRQERAEYVVTQQGKPVALLLPVSDEVVEKALVQAGRQSLAGSWEAYASLAETIRSTWPKDRKSQELLDGIRR